jgi:hypothetical protein
MNLIHLPLHSDGQFFDQRMFMESKVLCTLSNTQYQTRLDHCIRFPRFFGPGSVQSLASSRSTKIAFRMDRNGLKFCT